MIRSYITTLAVAAAAIVTMPSTMAFTVIPTIARRTPPRTNFRLASTTATATTPPLAPLTVWGEPYADILAAQQEAKQQDLPEFGPEISATTLGLSSHEEQLQYFSNHRWELLQQMQDHACLIFRDFSLMQTPEGLEAFYEALRMKPCLDPLHSVSARPTVSGDTNSPVYEAVNKESRKNFFIGMHNEFVGTRAPKAAAFGCFKAADVGGEFLIADGRRIFRDLPADLLHTLYTRQIRYSVMELPFFGWIDTKVPEFLQPPLLQILQGLVSTVINAKVDFSVEMQWGVSDYDHVRMLQARAPPQPPVVRHPITGDPTWFCNVHSHSSFLRQSREAIYGAERFEDGASRINKSDMFLGDDSELTQAQLQQMDEVTTRHMRFVKMRPGDVVLLDNYKTLHGRNVFDGTRKHGVCWFEGWEGEEEMMQKQQEAANTMNQQITIQ